MSAPLTADSIDVHGESIDQTASDAFESMDIEGDFINLHNFQIRNADVVAYLSTQPEEDRPQALRRAVEVGVFCLERASAARDTEFMKRQIERVLNEMDSKVGAIPAKVQVELINKIGMEDGQVLKPIFDATQRASKEIRRRIRECATFVAANIDPANKSSSVGKALNTVEEMLNPKNTDSVQYKLDAAISKVTCQDGALALAVKAVVETAMAPLTAELKELGKEVRGQDAAKQVLMETTAKGKPYEEEVVELLQPFAQMVGGSIEHVGADNRPGDILFTLTQTSICPADVRLIIEVRDRTDRAGRSIISKDLSASMAERSANAALYLSRTLEGFGREVCEWCEGETERGPWVATTHDHLRTAIRFLISLRRLRTLRSELPDVDTTAINNQIQGARTALKRIANINSKLTNIGTAADSIRTEAGTLRDEVTGALNAIEDTIRQAVLPRV